MSISKEVVEAEIAALSEKAENLVNERAAINQRRSEIDNEIAQIVGAIAALNKLISNKEDT